MRGHHSKELSSGDKISPYFMCAEGWLKSTRSKYFRTENRPLYKRRDHCNGAEIPLKVSYTQVPCDFV
jgi:hypothetical protein